MKLKWETKPVVYINHLIVQAETLLGCSNLEDVTAAKSAVTQFYQKFSLPGCVLITLGSQGLVYAADATSPIEHIPAEAVIAVDTTVRTYALT